MAFVLAAFIMLCLVAGVDFYVARRLWRGLSAVWPRVRFGAVLGVTVGLSVLLLLNFTSSFLPLPDAVTEVLATVGAYAMGVYLYLLMFTVIADAVLLILRWVRRSAAEHRRTRWIASLVTVGLTVVTVLYGVLHAQSLQHVTYTVPLDNAVDVSDLNIVLISDLHLGAVGSEARLPDVVEAINRQKPDVVCIAGDIFDTEFTAIRDPAAVRDVLATLRATYGVYACFGNHDGGETMPQMREFVKQCGITLLEDAYTVIDGRLVLAGRRNESPIGGSDGGERQSLAAILDGADPTLPVVVMDHNPARAADNPEADVVLSGHTHNGQVFPATLITELLYEGDYGLYRVGGDGSHVVVTSGAGTWGLPMRVGSDCEIVSICLK